MFTGSQAIFSGFINGPSNQPIWLNNVQCSGGEQSLFNCVAVTEQSCSHIEDAGITCSGGENTEQNLMVYQFTNLNIMFSYAISFHQCSNFSANGTSCSNW